MKNTNLVKVVVCIALFLNVCGRSFAASREKIYAEIVHMNNYVNAEIKQRMIIPLPNRDVLAEFIEKDSAIKAIKSRQTTDIATFRRALFGRSASELAKAETRIYQNWDEIKLQVLCYEHYLKGRTGHIVKPWPCYGMMGFDADVKKTETDKKPTKSLSLLGSTPDKLAPTAPSTAKIGNLLEEFGNSIKPVKKSSCPIQDPTLFPTPSTLKQEYCRKMNWLNENVTLPSCAGDNLLKKYRGTRHSLAQEIRRQKRDIKLYEKAYKTCEVKSAMELQTEVDARWATIESIAQEYIFAMRQCS